ncbi:uncharacterized protein LY89DRAFT_737880 [Mollisia scopiformis]|uniref:Uncharacterized protein n=1 Tax=Mollisia scopiformis TaxID=149040 RepID=A0A194WZ54_MOLSC|nr:uncharacterized protein LY89DRAFT_737880 [Mollisia scopiformis]KUJ12979.1 hypothetical protein LY89DRAFT_737880 [Mollisia scopiformis]
MKSPLYSITALVLGALAQNATELASTCPEVLVFNSTNIASLVPCTLLNYRCGVQPEYSSPNGSDRIIWNATASGPPAAGCTPYSFQIEVDESINGSLSIPNITNVASAVFEGGPVEDLNLTSLALDDLVTIGGDFYFKLADNLASLSVPRLTSVGDLEFHLGGENPASIDLSFPSLVSAANGIILEGNIDSIDLPVLSSAFEVNITSTGKLDCVSLAKSVVDTLVPVGKSANNTVICNSPQGSVTTYKAAKPTSGSERSFRLRGDLKVLGAFLGLLIITSC